MRRRPFLATSVAAGLSFLGGCLAGSSALDDWDFEDREAEAWSYYLASVDVLEAPDEQADERIETAIDELGDAREIYGTLAEEARDRYDEDIELFRQINDFFLTMRALVTASRNGLMPFIGEEPPGMSDDPEPFFRSAEDHYRDAREIYDDLDELQEAIDGDRFG